MLLLQQTNTGQASRQENEILKVQRVGFKGFLLEEIKLKYSNIYYFTLFQNKQSAALPAFSVCISATTVGSLHYLKRKV